VNSDPGKSLWRFSGSHGEQVTLRFRPALGGNDGAVIRDWELAGLGNIVRPERGVAGDLKPGRLIALRRRSCAFTGKVKAIRSDCQTPLPLPWRDAASLRVFAQSPPTKD
jgi:DNA-binding transcriptional LysR family regulator